MTFSSSLSMCCLLWLVEAVFQYALTLRVTAARVTSGSLDYEVITSEASSSMCYCTYCTLLQLFLDRSLCKEKVSVSTCFHSAFMYLHTQY